MHVIIDTSTPTHKITSGKNLKTAERINDFFNGLSLHKIVSSSLNTFSIELTTSLSLMKYFWFGVFIDSL